MHDRKKWLFLAIVSLCFFRTHQGLAQEGINDNWDNILYYSNKLGWGEGSWRHTMLAQGRFNNNFSTLEQWFLEYAATYLVNPHLEIVPDFRLTRKPNRREYRPGFGIIYKNLLPASQLVHQIKWQYDFKDAGTPDSHALRYAIFYNKKLKDKIIGTFIAGGIYEWGETFTGFWGMRSGFDISYVFNQQHRVAIGWLYGLVNTKEEPTRWVHVGIPTFTIAINIRKDFKYLPANYINF